MESCCERCVLKTVQQHCCALAMKYVLRPDLKSINIWMADVAEVHGLQLLMLAPALWLPIVFVRSCIFEGSIGSVEYGLFSTSTIGAFCPALQRVKQALGISSYILRK